MQPDRNKDEYDAFNLLSVHGGKTKHSWTFTRLTLVNQYHSNIHVIIVIILNAPDQDFSNAIIVQVYGLNFGQAF
jgi:hypothetical protein